MPPPTPIQSVQPTVEKSQKLIQLDSTDAMNVQRKSDVMYLENKAMIPSGSTVTLIAWLQFLVRRKAGQLRNSLQLVD